MAITQPGIQPTFYSETLEKVQDVQKFGATWQSISENKYVPGVTQTEQKMTNMLSITKPYEMPSLMTTPIPAATNVNAAPPLTAASVASSLLTKMEDDPTDPSAQGLPRAKRYGRGLSTNPRRKRKGRYQPRYHIKF